MHADPLPPGDRALQGGHGGGHVERRRAPRRDAPHLVTQLGGDGIQIVAPIVDFEFAWDEQEVARALKWSAFAAELTIDYLAATDARLPDVEIPEIHGVMLVDPYVMEELMPGVGRFRSDKHRVYVTGETHVDGKEREE